MEYTIALKLVSKRMLITLLKQAKSRGMHMNHHENISIALGLYVEENNILTGIIIYVMLHRATRNLSYAVFGLLYSRFADMEGASKTNT